MEGLIKGLFKVRWQPQLQFVRCKTKVNVTRPRPPHFERALVEKLCLPYFTPKKKQYHIPDFNSCVGESVFKSSVVEDHPLIEILAENNFNYFNNSKLIAFFHINHLTPEEKFEAQLLLKKNGMKLLFLSKIVLKKALTGTPFESVLGLYNAATATAFGSEPNINKLMKIDKKLSKLILMGAIVENRILGLNELKNYEKYIDITQARLNLVSLINSVPLRLVQQINYQPSNLVALLNQHKELLESGKS